MVWLLVPNNVILFLVLHTWHRKFISQSTRGLTYFLFSLSKNATNYCYYYAVTLPLMVGIVRLGQCLK